MATEFRWAPQNIEGKKLSGKCYEIDLETAGQKYLAAAPASKCRPSDDQITYRWIPKENAPGGKCFEVDINTSGEMFSQFANWKNCSPPNGQYILNEEKCYLVGQFNGSPFVKGVSFDFCKSEEVSYKFELAPNGLRGTCYEYDAIN